MNLTSALTARIVSSRPLVFDVIRNSGSKTEMLGNVCGLTAIALADDKLKDALSRLRFGQEVKVTAIYGGTPDYPHEVVLAGLGPPDSSPTAGTCTNRTGLLLSYRGLVEYVDVYNDGTISYHDPIFQVFDHQKLSAGDLGQLLASFRDAGFDSVPSLLPQIGRPFDRYSLALICSRLQGARTADIQGPKFAALGARLEDLKTRATSQTFYLLLTSGRIRQTILAWPFRDVPLAQLKSAPRYGPNVPAFMHDPVPADWLSRIPQSQWPLEKAQDPNRERLLHGRRQTLSRFRGNVRRRFASVQDVLGFRRIRAPIHVHRGSPGGPEEFNRGRFPSGGRHYLAIRTLGSPRRHPRRRNSDFERRIRSPSGRLFSVVQRRDL